MHAFLVNDGEQVIVLDPLDRVPRGFLVSWQQQLGLFIDPNRGTSFDMYGRPARKPESNWPIEPQGLARGLWIALAILTLALVIASIRPRYLGLQVISPLADSWQGELLPEDAAALERLGLTPRSYAAFFTGLETIVALVFLGVALFLFSRKSEDWMALLVSASMMTFGAVFTPMPDTLVKASPPWEPLLLMLRVVGLGSFVSILYLFPDGRFVPRWSRWLALVWVGYMLTWFFVPAWRMRMSLVARTPSEGRLMIWFFFFILSGAIAQIYRYRQISGPVQRQQTKWVVFGLTTTVIMGSIVGLPLLLFPSLQR